MAASVLMSNKEHHRTWAAEKGGGKGDRLLFHWTVQGAYVRSASCHAFHEDSRAVTLTTSLIAATAASCREVIGGRGDWCQAFVLRYWVIVIER